MWRTFVRCTDALLTLIFAAIKPNNEKGFVHMEIVLFYGNVKTGIKIS